MVRGRVLTPQVDSRTLMSEETLMLAVLEQAFADLNSSCPAVRADAEAYFLAYDADSLGSVAEVHLVEFGHGKIRILEKHKFAPSEKNGPVTGTLWLRLPTLERDPLYILDYVG